MPVLKACAVVVGLLGTCVAAAAEYPGYAVKPVVVEYDVDPDWPHRPDGVRPFGWVSGMDIDKEQNVWVFNRGEDPVQVYRPDGSFVRTWGRGRFDNPHQLRIGPDGNVWVADFGLHVVQKFTPEGELLQTLGVLGEAGEDEKHFNKPTDMAVTPAGDVFVTDGYGNRRVVHLDGEGKFVKAWGGYGTEPGKFVLPHAIVVDREGRLFVADRNSGRIAVFDQQGHCLDQWTGVIMPWGMWLTAAGDIWVCGSSPHWWFRGGKYPEYKDQVLMRFAADGRVRQLWGLRLGEPGKLAPGETIGAHCMAEDAAGNLYVGDIYGERAQKFLPVRERSEQNP